MVINGTATNLIVDINKHSAIKLLTRLNLRLSPTENNNINVDIGISISFIVPYISGLDKGEALKIRPTITEATPTLKKGSFSISINLM